jgi:3-hydroxyacyl-[acyl-carrier-protein] dehydratase
MNLPAPTDLLPHRPPFLFVSRLVSLEPGQRVVAEWDVPEDFFAFPGHFPGRPILPGVIALEALAQAGACGVLADPAFSGRLPLFGGLERARFKRMVAPGEKLTMEVDLLKLSRLGGKGRALATVEGAKAVEAELMFVFAPS